MNFAQDDKLLTISKSESLYITQASGLIRVLRYLAAFGILDKYARPQEHRGDRQRHVHHLPGDV